MAGTARALERAQLARQALGLCAVLTKLRPSCQNKITHEAKSTHQSQGKVYSVSTNFGSLTFSFFGCSAWDCRHPKHPAGQQRSAAVAGVNGLQGLVWGSWCLQERQELPLHQQILDAGGALCRGLQMWMGAGWGWQLALVKSKPVELSETFHPSWRLGLVTRGSIGWVPGQGVQGAWAEPRAVPQPGRCLAVAAGTFWHRDTWLCGKEAQLQMMGVLWDTPEKPLSCPRAP